MAWKLYSANRIAADGTRTRKGRKLRQVKKNGYYRLSLPHPMDDEHSIEESSPPYLEKNKYGNDHERLGMSLVPTRQHQSNDGVHGWLTSVPSTSPRITEFAVPTDPYHIVSTLEDSLIAKDENFKHTAMPEPVLHDKKSEKPSALGFSPERDFSAPQVIPFQTYPTTHPGHASPDISSNSPTVRSPFTNEHTVQNHAAYASFEATPPPVYNPNPRLDTL
ncbi:hypothetical protein CVT24_003721 [Panaeolus cyanescens]|uniref:Uncharacterized protein n=1 Tax=Panaeolus cyanescens TaxID=181874 RepID=A0A409YXP7_9AGAR|nr:hypothetical protein CVT24_003721 [Panaeolus cyanescens]